MATDLPTGSVSVIGTEDSETENGRETGNGKETGNGIETETEMDGETVDTMMLEGGTMVIQAWIGRWEMPPWSKITMTGT